MYKYDMILDSVVPENLEIAKSVQTGRVSDKLTNVSFTEGWFREYTFKYTISV